MAESLITRRALPAPRPPSGPGAAAGAAEEGAGFKDYFAALRRHWKLVLAVTVVALGMAMYRNATTEPLYSSAAVVQMGEKTSGGGGGLAGIAASLGGGGGSLSSQLEILRSRGILGQVVDSLGLRVQRPVPDLWRTTYQPTGLVGGVHVAPGAAAGTRLHLEFGDDGVRVRSGGRTASAAYGAPVETGGVRFTVPAHPGMETLELVVVGREAAIDGLQGHVRAFQRQQTDVVDVVVTGYDPVITERIANATVAKFRLFSSRTAREQAVRRRQYVEDQLRTTEAALREAQDQLTGFRKSQQLYSSRAELQSGQSERSELRLERAQLEANRDIYRTIAARLQRSGGGDDEALQKLVASPDVAGNATISGLYSRLVQLESSRDSLLSGPQGKSRTDPDVQRTESLIRQTRNQLTTATRSHVEWIDARISALDAVEAGIDRHIRQLSGAEPEELRLLSQVETYMEASKQLREKYYTAGIAEAVGEERVTLVDAALEGRRTGSGPGRSLVFGLLFGLLIGGSGAIALDRLNHSIRRRDEVERLLHVPGLGVIPPAAPPAVGRPRMRLPRQLTRRAADRSGGGGRLLPAAQVYSPGAEAYRTLRTNLAYGPTGERVKSITITSPSGSEGKTTTAANLAVSFRQQGRRVLVVDCDFYRARLHDVFGTPASPGLAQLLLGEAAFEQAIRETALEGVHLIPAGPLPQVINPADLVGESAMSRVLEVLAGEFDVILLDTPPVLASASAAVLSAQTDATLLVLRAGRTDRDSAREALGQIEALGGRVAGAVLNDPDAVAAHRNGYYAEVPAGASA